MSARICAATLMVLLAVTASDAARPPGAPPPSTQPQTRGDKLLDSYFEHETAAIAGRCLTDVKTLEDWTSKRQQYRQELAEMLGLWPMPARTDLKATITGKTETPEFIVEKLYFQSMPGLYVTANLYIPRGLKAPAPAILYVCGHSKKETGIIYGSKDHYQHHPEWFARNGYVCLIIDTLELGEVPGGTHHGTNSLDMWWWFSRGYTPAGVEAWNGIRALDYLCSRLEVDANRIGMTGRSGGGVYTWWVAALDERVKVAVPVSGMTDLQNYVVDGCIEGHCDCMFMVNTYRWDFPKVAALLAPRPLLIANNDKDWIFPLDGVSRLHDKVRNIYRLYGAEKNLGLLITEGPHKDSQDIQVPAFRWFNRFLKNDESTIDKVALPMLKGPQLKAMAEVPGDEINSKIQEMLVPLAPPPVAPESAEAWTKQRDAWMSALKEKTFAGWPAEAMPALDAPGNSELRDGIAFTAYNFVSEHDVPLCLYVVQSEKLEPKEVVLNVLDEAGWGKFTDCLRVGFEKQVLGPSPRPDAPTSEGRAAYERLAKQLATSSTAVAWIAPRGIGPTAWTTDPKKQRHIRRRYPLLGQTLDGMRVWDVRRAIQAVRARAKLQHVPLSLRAEGRMAGIALYASLYEPGVARLELLNLPHSHRDGPDLLNVLKFMDLPAAVAIAAERSKVTLYESRNEGWEFPGAVMEKLGWEKDRFKVAPVEEWPGR